MTVSCRPLLSQQKPSQEERDGIVTGQVYCGDTREPARFATVTVQPLNTSSSNSTGRSDTALPTMTYTDLEGKFTVQDLLPGYYLVLAWLPGYISPLSRLNASMATPQRELQELAGLLPRVEVKNHLPTMIDITLVRGAEVMGTVAYDDGSPAVGFRIELLHPFGIVNSGHPVTLGNSTIDFGYGGNTTDDRGQYRLSGVPPGSYILAASSPMTSPHGGGVVSGSYKASFPPHISEMFRVYSGNKMRFKSARVISLTRGEKRSDVDITIPLSQLYRVAGMVVDKNDGLILNRGLIQLLNADDMSVAQETHLDDDGRFVLNYIQGGSYLLKVDAAASVDRRTYREQITPIEVSGNMSDLTIFAVPNPTD